MSAVYVHGIAPFSRIQATATDVSKPPENAMPTRLPTGRDVRTLLTLCSFFWLLVVAGGEGEEALGELRSTRGVARDDHDGVVTGDRAQDLGDLGLVDGRAQEVR